MTLQWHVCVTTKTELWTLCDFVTSLCVTILVGSVQPSRIRVEKYRLKIPNKKYTKWIVTSSLWHWYHHSWSHFDHLCCVPTDCRAVDDHRLWEWGQFVWHSWGLRRWQVSHHFYKSVCSYSIWYGICPVYSPFIKLLTYRFDTKTTKNPISTLGRL